MTTLPQSRAPEICQRIRQYQARIKHSKANEELDKLLEDARNEIALLHVLRKTTKGKMK
jgi:hypothetical protein